MIWGTNPTRQFKKGLINLLNGIQGFMRLKRSKIRRYTLIALPNFCWPLKKKLLKIGLKNVAQM